MKPNNSDPIGYIRILATRAFIVVKTIARFVWIVIYSALPWPCLVYSIFKLLTLLGSIGTAYAATGSMPDGYDSFQAISWASLVLYTGIHALHDWHDAMHRLSQLRRAMIIIYVVIMIRLFNALLEIVITSRALVKAIHHWVRSEVFYR